MSSVTLRTKPIFKKGFSLFLDIYNEGYRYKEYLKLYVSKDYTQAENKNVLRPDKDSWELAKAIQAKRLINMKESAAGFIPRVVKHDFIKYYKEKAAIKSHSSYRNALLHLTAFNKGEKLSFKNLNEIFLKDFIEYLKSQNLSITSVRIYLSRLNIVLNLAVKEKIILVNPINYLKKGKGGDIPAPKQKKIEYLTIEELRKLNETEYRRDVKEYFLFCCFTGLRESDLLKLKWSDIDKGILTYTQKKQQDSVQHYLPLSKQALSTLETITETQKQKSGETVNIFLVTSLQKGVS
jgi:integrase